MTEGREKKGVSVKDIIVIGVQIILVPVLFSFDARIRDIEKDQIRIETVDKKIDKLIELQEKSQTEMKEFYKEYGGALDYSKREMQKK